MCMFICIDTLLIFLSNVEIKVIILYCIIAFYYSKILHNVFYGTPQNFKVASFI